MNTLQFFLPMLPPTATHQEKSVRVLNGKPVLYEPAKLKAARAKLEAHLAGHAPPEPWRCGVRLVVKWLFPLPKTGGHASGDYKLTPPDTDNLQKLLKDCMTAVGFWKDDALVASEIAEKFYAEPPGIFIRVEELCS